MTENELKKIDLYMEEILNNLLARRMLCFGTAVWWDNKKEIRQAIAELKTKLKER